jgi:hypothetical protein
MAIGPVEISRPTGPHSSVSVSRSSRSDDHALFSLNQNRVEFVGTLTPTIFSPSLFLSSPHRQESIGGRWASQGKGWHRSEPLAGVHAHRWVDAPPSSGSQRGPSSRAAMTIHRGNLGAAHGCLVHQPIASFYSCGEQFHGRRSTAVHRGAALGSSVPWSTMSFYPCSMWIKPEVSPRNPSFRYSVFSFLLLPRHRSTTLESWLWYQC